MSVNSLDGEISIGTQSAKATAATAYRTCLATVSGGDVRFDERQPLKEHPGGAGIVPFDIKSAIERTGYLTPFNATFLLRPRFIGNVFRGIFDTSAVNNTTHFTHTFLPAENASLDWLSVLVKFVGTTSFERRLLDCRVTQLGIDAQTDQIQCTLQGLGLVEGDSLGSETKVAEIATEMSPYSGSITWSIAGTSITHNIRGANVQITQTLDEDDKILFSNTRADLARKSIGVTGTIRGINMDDGTYNVYKLVKRLATGGTAPSLSAPTGPLTLTFQSLSNISGAAVPFRLTMAFAKVQYDFETPNNNADDFVRADVGFRLIADSTPAMTFTLVNDQSAYT